MQGLTQQYLETAISTMRKRRIKFAPGLTAREIENVETVHGFRMPPDLRSFLEHALPVGDRFPDWRDPESESLLNQLAWPAEGICFDVEHSGIWINSWGPQPESLAEAQTKAHDLVRLAPFLIPVYGHRYLPAVPCEPGNPIFSIVQTDIICYGTNLPCYLAVEFNVPNPYPVPEATRQIEFWTDLCE